MDIEVKTELGVDLVPMPAGRVRFADATPAPAASMARPYERTTITITNRFGAPFETKGATGQEEPRRP